MFSEMKNGFNLIGNISYIGDIKEQANGNKYRYFSIAQNNNYKNKDEEDVKTTSFYSIKIYEKDFEKFDSLLEVGKYVLVTGRLTSYLDEDKKTVEIKIGKYIKDLNNNKIPEEQKKLLEELEDYNWLEDNGEQEI